MRYFAYKMERVNMNHRALINKFPVRETNLAAVKEVIYVPKSSHFPC